MPANLRPSFKLILQSKRVLLGQRGRGTFLDFALLVTILLCVVFIGYSLWKRDRRNASPTSVAIHHPQNPSDSSPSQRLTPAIQIEELPPNSYRRLKIVEDLVAQKMNYSDSEWANLRASTILANSFSDKSPGCDRFRGKISQRAYWIISDQIAEQILNTGTAIIPNIKGERCFLKGPEAPLYHFTSNPERPAASLIGQIQIDSILSLKLEHLTPEVAAMLKLTEEDLKNLLSFPSRKPEQNSAFVRVRLMHKGPKANDETGKDQRITPGPIPRLSRLSPGILDELITEAKSQGNKVTVLDLRTPTERTDTLFETPEFKNSPAAKWLDVRSSVFKLSKAEDEGRQFRFEVTLGEVKNSDVRLNLPSNYTPNMPLIVTAVDEYDARAFWLMLILAIDHPSFKVFWGREGAEKLANEAMLIRGI